MNEQDKFNNEEEYHFIDDPELISAEDGSHSEEDGAKPETLPKEKSVEGSQLTKLGTLLGFAKPALELLQKNFALRMSVIGIAALFLILIIYRCTAHHNAIAPQTHTMPMRSGEMPQQMRRQIQPAQKIDMNMSSSADTVSNKKLIDLESAQSGLQAQVNELSTQLSGVNENVNAMVEHLKQLNDQMTQLAASVQEQAKITVVLSNELKQHAAKKVIPKSRPFSSGVPPVRYVLQAVIPGRAWLVDSNGDTLTVREGSKVMPYGVVRYIDAKRGRVLTSSGRIIKFDQNDS